MSNKMVPPTSGGFSVASAGSRLNAGQAGIYRKRQSVLLCHSKPAAAIPVGTQITLNAYVNCPSSRIRVSFGISGKTGNINDTGNVYTLGTGSIWNAVPQIYLPDSYNFDVGGGTGDHEPYLSGRPIFFLPPDNWPAAPSAGFKIAPPPYWESFSAIGGGSDGYGGIPNTTPEINLHFDQYGRYLPDSYEAVSNADRYKIYAWIQRPLNNLAPIQAWAVWEILDPRDEEDSQALLAQCSLAAPPALL